MIWFSILGHVMHDLIEEKCRTNFQFFVRLNAANSTNTILVSLTFVTFFRSTRIMAEHAQANIVQFYCYSKLEPFPKKYTDVTIECDGIYFKCHRLILARASEVFDNMFHSKKTEEQSVSIREVTAETLSQVLQFIYTGAVSLTSTNVCNLFKASKFFDLPGIADLCLNKIR